MLSRSFKTHLTLYLLVNVFLIGIWAASGGGYFWPDLVASSGGASASQPTERRCSGAGSGGRPMPSTSVEEVASSGGLGAPEPAACVPRPTAR